MSKSKTDLPEDLNFLSPEARQEWPRMVKALQELDRFDPDLDRTALAMGCQSWSRFVQAVHVVEQKGLMYIADDGQVCWDPALQIARDALDQVHDILGEFGLTFPL